MRQLSIDIQDLKYFHHLLDPVVLFVEQTINKSTLEYYSMSWTVFLRNFFLSVQICHLPVSNLFVCTL